MIYDTLRDMLLNCNKMIFPGHLEGTEKKNVYEDSVSTNTAEPTTDTFLCTTPRRRDVKHRKTVYIL